MCLQCGWPRATTDRWHWWHQALPWQQPCTRDPWTREESCQEEVVCGLCHLPAFHDWWNSWWVVVFCHGLKICFGRSNLQHVPLSSFTHSKHGLSAGGYFAGSLAVMTDAAHLLVDFLSFIISLLSLWLSSRPATHKLNYGWHRAGTLTFICVWVLFVSPWFMFVLLLSSFMQRSWVRCCQF